MGKCKFKTNTRKSRKTLENSEPKATTSNTMDSSNIVDELENNTRRAPSTAPSSSGYKPVEVIHEDIFEMFNEVYVEKLGRGVTDEERKIWNKSFERAYGIAALMIMGMKMSK